MNQDIEAILLDVGNTLRIVIKDDEFTKAAKQQMLELLDVKEDPEEFFETLETRWKAHRKRCKQTLVEASERELWAVHLLPDYPKEKIEPLAGRLTRLWRDKDGRRVPRSDVKETIIELDRRGYKLGIIANTITETPKMVSGRVVNTSTLNFELSTLNSTEAPTLFPIQLR